MSRKSDRLALHWLDSGCASPARLLALMALRLADPLASHALACTTWPCTLGCRSARTGGRDLDWSALPGSRTATSSRSPGLAPTDDLPGTAQETATSPDG